jgi:hypothetical protein
MLYVYNMQNMAEKPFCISIAHVRSRGGSLVVINKETGSASLKKEEYCFHGNTMYSIRLV